ncbi:MAG: PPC domain-containing protein [Polyangia bacterium]
MSFLRSSLFATFGLGAVALLGVACYNPKFASPGFACDDSDPKTSECPSGQACVGTTCVTSTGPNNGCVTAFTIAKTSTYNGATSNPMLDTIDECPDAKPSQGLEPNDDSCTATVLPAVTVGGTPLKLQSLAICPTGNNPDASGHDVDVYLLNVPSTTTALVEITYDVKYGDLDLGVFRKDGTSSAVDGSAISNACVAPTLAAGDYYIVVSGAGSMAVNRYSMSIRFGAALSCTTAP